MLVSLRQLGYVIEAASVGSVAGAAKSLNISASSILMAIDKFEEDVGLQVFVRHRARGLTVTAAGSRVIARTIRFLDEFNAYQTDLHGGDAALTGTIEVGCFSSISPNIAPLVIRDLQDRYPDLKIDLHEGDLHEIQDLLRSGKVDLLLTYDRGMPDDFDMEFLAEAPPHVLLSEEDPLVNLDYVTLEQICDRPLLLLNLPQSGAYIMSLYERAGLSPASIQRMESFEMLRSSAAAGLGVAILNIKPLTDLTYSGLRVVCQPLKHQLPNPSIVIATRKGGGVSRRAQVFAQCCRDFFETEASRSLFFGWKAD